MKTAPIVLPQEWEAARQQLRAAGAERRRGQHVSRVLRRTLALLRNRISSPE